MKKNTPKKEETIIKGFKGFDSNLKCRDMQYEIGKTYKEKEAVICESGFHFCENPLDIFNYYPPADSRFAEVEGKGKISKEENSDTKVACTELHIKAEVTLKSILDFGVKFILDRVNWTDAKESNTGDRSAATNTGYRSAATNTGDSSAATNTGYSSAATNTGYRSAATNTGYSSAATNTGDRSAATNTGYSSAATNTGYSSAATNTGYSSAAIVEGKESVAISIGIQGKAKGKIGCFIVIAEWERRDDGWHRTNVLSLLVDGVKIKEDTFYMMKDGNPTETE